MEGCVFCKIIRRELESSLVYEDDRSIAFLPLKPINPGHTLLMPKAHYEDIFHTPPVLALHLLTVAKEIARALQATFAPLRVGLAAMGLDVAHAHLHVLPLRSRFDSTSKTEMEGRLVQMTRSELDAHATLIRSCLAAGDVPKP